MQDERPEAAGQCDQRDCGMGDSDLRQIEKYRGARIHFRSPGLRLDLPIGVGPIRRTHIPFNDLAVRVTRQIFDEIHALRRLHAAQLVLAPEHKFPAAFDDCVSVVKWVSRHGAEWGADTTRLVVTGDSAGGNLAACACAAAEVAIALQILVYPVLHIGPDDDLPSRSHFGDGSRFLTRNDILRAETEYLPNARQSTDPRVNPFLIKQLEGLPPTLIVAAQFDPLRDESLRFHRHLLAAGAHSQYWEAPGMIHGFVLFGGALAMGRRVTDALGDVVRQLRPTEARQARRGLSWFAKQN